MSDLSDQLTMHFRIIKRIITLLFTKHKSIEVISFTYKPDFETNDTLIIRFAFRNALWYRFDGTKTLNGRHVVVRHSNLTKEIPLIVQGFCRKRKYAVKLQPDAVLLIEAVKPVICRMNFNNI